MADAELSTDLADVAVFVLERESRCPRDHEQTMKVGEGIDDLLGDPVTQVFLVSRLTQVDEGEDCDAVTQLLITRNCLRRPPMLPGHERNHAEQHADDREIDLAAEGSRNRSPGGDV